MEQEMKELLMNKSGKRLTDVLLVLGYATILAYLAMHV